MFEEFEKEILKKISRETLIKMWEEANKPEPPAYVPEHGDFGLDKGGDMCGAILDSDKEMLDVSDDRSWKNKYACGSFFHVACPFFNAFTLVKQIQAAMGKADGCQFIKDVYEDKLYLPSLTDTVDIGIGDKFRHFTPNQAFQIAAMLMARAIAVREKESK